MNKVNIYRCNNDLCSRHGRVTNVGDTPSNCQDCAKKGKPEVKSPGIYILCAEVR